jgi:hypothetical protein
MITHILFIFFIKFYRNRYQILVYLICNTNKDGHSESITRADIDIRHDFKSTIRDDIDTIDRDTFDCLL